jgi:polyhydroxyalkanoate synthase
MNELPKFTTAAIFPPRRSRSARRQRRSSDSHVFLSMLPDLPGQDRHARFSANEPEATERDVQLSPNISESSAETTSNLTNDLQAATCVEGASASCPSSAADDKNSPPAHDEMGGLDLVQASANMFNYFANVTKTLNACIVPHDVGKVDPMLVTSLMDSSRAFRNVAEHWLSDPSRLVEAQSQLTTGLLDSWSGKLRASASQDNAPMDAGLDLASDLLQNAHVISTRWADDMIARADSVDSATRDKAAFYARQLTAATAPANFVWSNPELFRDTLSQSGANLVRGMDRLAEDVEAGRGRVKIRHSAPAGDRLGVEVAASPGKVVFKNELMELIQYSPTTTKVYRRPLLIVPPWINKFYILDLNRQRSFVGWAVSQGLTVFMISWVNPDESHAHLGFEDYMRGGVLTALDCIAQACGERKIAALGYCVGGTLLAVSLAYMAALGDDRIGSATLLTTQVDFREAGDLKLFIDEAGVRLLSEKMEHTGFLDAEQMAGVFNLLRPQELIWPYVVRSYLEGKEPVPFDMLSWNADATRMTPANHLYYLKNFYLENRFAEGRLTLGGVRLDLRRVSVPVYHLATRDDHIAPARSVYTGALRFAGPVKYVLSGSGHIAGVINHPSKSKYQYWTGDSLASSYEAWLEQATETPGSWWPDWVSWLVDQAPGLTESREVAAGGLPPISEAPGEYVRVMA